MLREIPLSLLSVRQAVRWLPRYILARILCDKRVAAAGMAHGSADICHTGPIALCLCFSCDLLDLGAMAIEIRSALRMDPVIRRIHM